MLWNPPGVSSASDATIAKGESSVLYRLNATGEAQTRAWKIAVLGAATVNGGTLNVSSQLAGLEIAPPFVAGKIETVSTSPGLSARIVCKLEQRQPFDGKATVKLMGLPEKVTVSEKQISKDDTEVVFDLAVDAKATCGGRRQ